MDQDFNYSDYLNIGIVDRKITTTFDKNKNTEKQQEFHFYNAKKNEYKVFYKSNFIKIHTGRGKSISKILKSDADIGKMHRIMENINKQNMVMYDYDEREESIPANTELMLKLIGGHPKRAKEFLNNMVDLGIIRAAGDKECIRYYVNPLYTMASTGITPELYSLFRELLVPELPEQAVKDLDRLAYFQRHPEVLADLKEEHEEEMQNCDDGLLEIMESYNNNRLTEDERQENQTNYKGVQEWIKINNMDVAISILPENMTNEKMEIVRDAIINNSGNTDAIIKAADGILIPVVK